MKNPEIPRLPIIPKLSLFAAIGLLCVGCIAQNKEPAINTISENGLSKHPVTSITSQYMYEQNGEKVEVWNNSGTEVSKDILELATSPKAEFKFLSKLTDVKIVEEEPIIVQSGQKFIPQPIKGKPNLFIIQKVELGGVVVVPQNTELLIQDYKNSAGIIINSGRVIADDICNATGIIFVNKNTKGGFNSNFANVVKNGGTWIQHIN